MIQELLKSKDGTSRSKEKNLPELTPEETASAITKERMRRAERLYCDVDSINLSDEAIIKVLQNAREHKLSNQKTSEYWKKVDQEKVYHLPDAEELFKQFKANATQIIKREFEIDVFNQALIKRLCLYFSADPIAEKYGISLHKGLILAGGTGSGKTTIMKAFQSNPYQSFRMVDCRSVGYNYSINGFEEIMHYSKIESIPVNLYGQTDQGICFDDLGTDEERKHYGDKVNPLTNILLDRHRLLPFHKTYLTTNLNADMIEVVYGTRLRGRLREMFNLINFDQNTPDRRK
jgi:flagellar biosynthesis GTPase FlhF